MKFISNPSSIVSGLSIVIRMQENRWFSKQKPQNNVYMQLRYDTLYSERGEMGDSPGLYVSASTECLFVFLFPANSR